MTSRFQKALKQAPAFLIFSSMLISCTQQISGVSTTNNNSTNNQNSQIANNSSASGSSQIPGGVLRAVYAPLHSYSGTSIVEPKWENINEVKAFGLGPKVNGELDTAEISDQNYQNFLNLARSKGYPLTLTVGGAGAYSSNFSAMSANASARTTFANSVKNYLQAHGFRGVNIDWEFPTSTTDASNFESMIIALKNTLAGKYSLSVSLPVLNNTNKKFFTANMLAQLDQADMMAYDYYTPSGKVLDYKDQSPYSLVKRDVDYWIQFVAPQKLVLGIPLYGIFYHKDSDGTINALGQQGVNFYEGFVNIGDTVVITSEADRALKAQLVKDYNLKGVMYWEASHNGNTDQWNFLKYFDTKLKALGL